MQPNKIEKRVLFDSLPPEWPVDLLPAIRQKVQASGRKVIVLDDDPTGTQTVHGIPVLTSWEPARLQQELAQEYPAVYLLTNSRSLPQDGARSLNLEIAAALRAVQASTGQDFTIVSRSDSTLRGHFPAELEALEHGLEQQFDAWLVIPFFIEGGRYTVNDVHYVAEGDWLVPAGETEFARDKAFGYHSSDLRSWVAEKTLGNIPSDKVSSISLETIRGGGPEAVTHQLLALPQGAACIVNAASYRDLEVFVLGLLEAEAQGKQYLYRTAASFVRVRAGIASHPLLERDTLALPLQGAGLIVAGSYVPKTSTQIEILLQRQSLQAVEVRVPRLLDDASREAEIERAATALNAANRSGQDALLFTSRDLISAESAEGSLAIGRVVSDSLVSIVRRLEERPRYLLAKGGITSSDIATRGLGIQRALVLGQILPGVPVWQSGPESRFPGLAYIVFPGNVGGPDALADVAGRLST